MISCDKCWADWAKAEKEWHYHGCRSKPVTGTSETARWCHHDEDALKARVAALLKRIEWGGEYGCVECGSGLVNEKHAPDCELAALLRECEA